MKRTISPEHLPKYNDGIAAALLSAREAVMSPIRPILRKQNLTEQQWRLLRVLIDIGPMDVSRAAEASMIMAPSLTRIQKELISRNLIVKVLDQCDKRKSTLSVTNTGRTLVRKIARETAALLSDYKTQFGDKRFNQLIKELQEFRRAIRDGTD